MTQDTCGICTKPTTQYDCSCHFCRRRMHPRCDVDLTPAAAFRILASVAGSYWFCSVECAEAADVRRSLE